MKDHLRESPFRMEINSKYGNILYSGTFYKARLKIYELELDHFINNIMPVIIHSFDGSIIRKDKGLFVFEGRSLNFSYSNIIINSESGFNGNYNLKEKTIGIDGLGLKIKESRFYVEKFKYDMQEKTAFISTSAISAKLSDFIQGSPGTINGGFELNYSIEPDLSGKIYLSNYNYQWFQDISAVLNFNTNSLQAEITGTIPGGNLRADISSPNFLTEPYNVKIESEKIEAEQLFSLLKRNQTSAPTPAFNNYKIIKGPIRLDIFIHSIIYKKINLENAVLNCIWEPPVFTIENSTADFLRGKISMEGKLEKGIFKGGFNYKDARLKEFTTLFLTNSRKLYGNLDAQGNIEIDLTNMLSSKGNFKAEIKNGEIKDFIVQNQVSEALFDIPLDNIFFDDITFDGKYRDSFFEINDFHFNSEGIKIDAEGLFNLTNKEIQLKMDTSFTKDYLSGLPNVAQIFTSGYEEGGRIAFHLSVSGPWNKPTITLLKNQ